MKLTLFFISALIILLSISCNTSPTVKISKEDSLKIFESIQAKNNKVFFLNKKDSLHSFAPQPIAEDSVVNMTYSYQNTFDLGLLSESQDRIKGFVINQNDFERISRGASNFKSIALYFGVKNYNEANSGSEQPIYTMIVVPINRDGSAARNLAFDYVLPCPKNCPTNGF